MTGDGVTTVLGVDPGTQHTGWGVVARTAGGKIRHVANGVIAPSSGAELAEKLVFIRDGLRAVVELWRPESVAVEDLFVHRNARSALVLGHARAVALLVAADAGLAVSAYAPSEVKQSAVGNGRAEKAQVQEMVKFLLALPDVAPEDASDALAIAICHLQRGRPLPIKVAAIPRLR
jgi:crossover junction endodeoxyribonuclease RuvC